VQRPFESAAQVTLRLLYAPRIQMHKLQAQVHSMVDTRERKLPQTNNVTSKKKPQAVCQEESCGRSAGK
jgi:hypothetical protein